VWKIYFEFKEMIELKKAKLNKQKNLVNQGFFLSISMPPACLGFCRVILQKLIEQYFRLIKV